MDLLIKTVSSTKYDGKIETFDPCIINVQERNDVHECQSQETIEVHIQTNEQNEISGQEEIDQPMPPAEAAIQNLALTPVRLPAILDGEFFSVTRVDDSNVTVRCLQCQKLLNGNLKSTGNFLSHIKRVHPFMIEKIKSKSNQRKPAVAYIDLSADKCPEVIRTKRGYRKCYKTLEEITPTNHEENADQSPTNWSESPNARRRRSDDYISTDTLKLPHGNTIVIEDEFDAIGRNVAAKLRNMRLDQRIIAEKLLNDVLFEAQLGTLQRDSNLRV